MTATITYTDGLTLPPWVRRIHPILAAAERDEVSGSRGQWQYLRWVDHGGVGGDDDADDGEGLSAVRAAVLSAAGGDVVRKRSRDGKYAGHGEWDGGDDVVGVVVAVPLAPGGLAAFDVAVPLA